MFWAVFWVFVLFLFQFLLKWRPIDIDHRFLNPGFVEELIWEVVQNIRSADGISETSRQPCDIGGVKLRVARD